MSSPLYQLVSTGKKRFIPTDTTDNNKFDNDYLYEDLKDLVNEQFKGWYMKMFYKLGREKVLQLASQARSDSFNHPQRLFSYLLKKQVK